MYRSRFLPAALAVAIGLYGCGGASDPAPKFESEDDVEAAESTAPLFDVTKSEFPIPNDILFSIETAGDGTMFASADTSNPVFVGLDHMDGASTLAHIDIKLDGSLDASQTLDANPFVVHELAGVIPNPNQNVFLIPLWYPGGDPLLNPNEVPTLTPAFNYARDAALAQGGDLEAAARLAALPGNPEVRADIISLDGGTNNVIRLTPLQPLQAKTKYLVVITKDLEDAGGEPIEESLLYELLSDFSVDQGGDLGGVQDAIEGWEQLAAGYFAFIDTVYEQFAGLGITINSDVNRGIALSYTFTTGSPESVLEAIAAPSEFFEDTFITIARQEAIGKLVAGTYNLAADNDGLGLLDAGINTQLNAFLTEPAAGWPYYNPDLDTAITAGVYSSFADVASDSSLSFLVQLAAADAAVAVQNADVEINCDPATDSIRESSVCTVAGLISGAAQEANSPLPLPKARPNSFYRQNCMGPDDVPPANCSDENRLRADLVSTPAIVAQGQITLPYYLKAPASEVDGTNMVTGVWEADEDLYNDISALIEAGGADPLPSFPSNKTTYRNPFPVKQADVTVPLLAVYPDEAAGAVKPEDGWPVIIYLHGITSNRSAIIPLAGALASTCLATPADCFATVAIDQPLHGIPPSGGFGMTSVDDPDVAPDAGGTQIGANTPAEALAERHFNFYLGQTGLPTVMDYTNDIGTSGTLFVNLSSFATSRDNNRQSAVDMLNLLASLKDMDVDGDGNPDFDTSRVFFVGHSLGGVNGIPFLATNNKSDVQTAQAAVRTVVFGGAFQQFGDVNIANAFADANATVAVQMNAAALFNTGGHITQLLMNSPNLDFGAAAILQGLSASTGGTVVQGTSALETFNNVIQALLDSGDALNFAASMAEEANTGILLTEIIGGDTVTVKPEDDPTGDDVDVESPPDQTIPNDADADVWTITGVGPFSTVLDNGFTINSFATPMAGTEPLIDEFGATKTANLDIDGENTVIGVTRFTRGSHATPVTAGTQVVGDQFVDRFSQQDVFLEMVSQTAGLFSSDGVSLSITNADVVEE